MRTFNIPYKYKEWPRWLKDLVNLEIKNLLILRLEECHISFGSPTTKFDEEDLDTYYVPKFEKNIIKSF
jgi:hypothetical protein